jgi:hypothetical protein
MIIATNQQMKVGSIHNDMNFLNDMYGVSHPPQPVLVLREATYNEYRDYTLSMNSKSIVASPKDYPYHYEISMD